MDPWASALKVPGAGVCGEAQEVYIIPAPGLSSAQGSLCCLHGQSKGQGHREGGPFTVLYVILSSSSQNVFSRGQFQQGLSSASARTRCHIFPYTVEAIYLLTGQQNFLNSTSCLKQYRYQWLRPRPPFCDFRQCAGPSVCARRPGPAP